MRFVIDSARGHQPPTDAAQRERITWQDAQGGTHTDEQWTIEIATLADLLALAKHEDTELIVGHRHMLYEMPSIRVYDGYNE